MVSELVEILKRVKSLAGAEFTGVGVIVSDVEAELPTFPLRLGVDVPQDLDSATTLANVSIVHSDLHDGFHVLAPDLRVVALSQYFSPPIVESAVINRKRKFGGRYIAALFGSALPSVHLCGVATDSLGIVIFKDGREIYFERF